MNQIESQWDKLLKIKTTGRDDSRSDQYRYPYEPTQYLVLERLANSGLIFPIRRDADLSVWNMMSVFLVQQNLTENMRYRAEEYLLS